MTMVIYANVLLLIVLSSMLIVLLIRFLIK